MRRTTILTNDRTGSESQRRTDRRELRVATVGGGALRVTGDLDAASAPAMERALIEAEAAHDDRGPLVVDLRGVAFMDSSGLRTLVAASLRAGRRGTRVALRNVGPELGRLLEITGLRDQFDLPAAGAADRAWQPSDARAPTIVRPGRRRG
jgi:anti-anti-sigma factor